MLSGHQNATGRALILAAHGSSAHPRINDSLFAVADRVRGQADFSTVTPAFLDGNPSLENVLDNIAEDDITVVPVMASQGYYSDVVFPKLLQRPGKNVFFTSSVGVSSRWPEAFAARVRLLTERNAEHQDSVIIVVGHGTRKNKNSCRSTIDVTQRLRTQLPEHSVQFAFLDQKPTLQHVLSRWSGQNRIVLPFLFGMGPHVTDDIPNALGLEPLGDSVFQPDFSFPVVISQTIAGGQPITTLYDQPAGKYEELSVVCVELAQHGAETVSRCQVPDLQKETIS